MQCPNCKARLSVRDTDDLDNLVIRIRRCKVCGFRLETTERVTAVLTPAHDIPIASEVLQQSV